MREPVVPSPTTIRDWERRISDARVRLTGEMQAVADESPLRREGKELLEELMLAFEELQVAEEELRVQTEELTSSRAMLDAERARYRALFEQAPVAYLVTDKNGVIGDANGAAASLLGIAQRELSGKPLSVFVSSAHRRAFRDRLGGFAPNDLAVAVSLRLRPRGGTTLRIAAIVGAATDRRGAVGTLRWLLIDETARRRRERRVRSMNEMLKARVDERTAELARALEAQEELARAAEVARQAAERASRDKSELIAIVSHELRTPLAAIGGYAELLTLGIRGPLSELQRTDVQRIQEAQSHILRLVDDLVGYSKLETGRFRFDIADVIVRDAIDALVSLVRPQAAAKGVAIEVEPVAADAVVRADDERLRQIILNLLSNAIKFTSRGGHVWLGCAARETEVRIQIRDDGIGIPADKLETIFEPYVQLAPGGPRHEMGWGLGLAISRDLARAMGGDLVANSTSDGTVFTVTLQRSTRIAPT